MNFSRSKNTKNSPEQSNMNTRIQCNEIELKNRLYFMNTKILLRHTGLHPISTLI